MFCAGEGCPDGLSLLGAFPSFPPIVCVFALVAGEVAPAGGLAPPLTVPEEAAPEGAGLNITLSRELKNETSPGLLFAGPVGPVPPDAVGVVPDG